MNQNDLKTDKFFHKFPIFNTFQAIIFQGDKCSFAITNFKKLPQNVLEIVKNSKNTIF